MARYRVREINRDEPADDENTELREEFERLPGEAAQAEQKARDRLSNAVALSQDPAPCAVIVDSAGAAR